MRASTNLLWYGNFQATAKSSGGGKGGGKGGGGGGGKGGAGSPSTYEYSAAVAMGLCEGPIGGIGTIWANKDLTSMSALGLTLFTGTAPQATWGYLTTNFPSEAISYPGIAYVATGYYDMGTSPTLPNHNFEVQGLLIYGNGVEDANPAAFIPDFLTNPQYGVGFASAQVGDMTQYSDYCVANGLFLSPALAQQKSASQWISDWLQQTNSAAIWSEGRVKIIPYGDEPVTGNGATFTPSLTVQYDLTDDDFLDRGHTDPITITRKTKADAYNQVKITYKARSNSYDPARAVANDTANIETYGLRVMPDVQADGITSANVALTVANLILQRQLYIRNTFEFDLGLDKILLEPMDIVTLTDARLGLDQFPVRITSIEENEKGNLTVQAEEFPSGVATAGSYATQAPAGFTTNYNVSPPLNLSPAVIFDAPPQLANQLELWCAIGCNLADYGGCDIYVSFDDQTYKKVETVYGSATYGTLTAILPLGSDPDLIDTLSVDLNYGNGTLLGGAQSDADLFHTLCYADGELVSYETATFTGTGGAGENKYSLSYLRRGGFGTDIAAHNAGTPFVRIDQAVAQIPYTKEHIGKTVYFKFLPFNPYGGGQVTLADVNPTTYTIKGPASPPAVQGFSVSQNGGAVTFVWDPVDDFALKGYDIRYGVRGNAWSAMETLTEVAAGTEMTNASVAPGTWTFAICAHDIADQLSTPVYYDYTVTNENDVILADREDPGFAGTLTGCYRHWTGVVVPLDQNVASHYTQWEDFGVGSTSDNPSALPWIPFPVASCTYDTDARDTGFNDTLRVYATMTAVPGPGISGTQQVSFSIDTWLTGSIDPGIWSAWTTSPLQMRYIRGRVTLAPGAVPAYLSAFTLHCDKPNATVVDGSNVTIPAGGASITFSQPFHSPPQVTATYVGSGALFASATSITTTAFTAHVWDTSGTDVGGNINWTGNGY
ncbi:MAG: phage tail protein [Betaproteobacteria bacterium]|nr:phage tail protein [Betaproteobacteria bacterium]